MKPNARKLFLTAHITVSVGWIGAVLAYLALVVVAMTGQSDQLLRSSWLALAVIGWYVIVPLALAALATGVGIAVGAQWSLFRHYWVAISLLLTVVATAVLLKHMWTVTSYASIAADAAITDVRGVLGPALKGELLHAGLGLIVLLGIATLNVYKPRGLTAYGRTRARAVAEAASNNTGRTVSRSDAPARTPGWVLVTSIHGAALLLLLAILHATGSLRLHG